MIMIDEQLMRRGKSEMNYSVFDSQFLIYCMQEEWWRRIETLKTCCCGWIWRGRKNEREKGC
jgi:hypothetical protein